MARAHVPTIECFCAGLGSLRFLLVHFVYERFLLVHFTNIITGNRAVAMRLALLLQGH